MIEIPLTQGKVAIVDNEDYELVSHYKWCAAKSNNGKVYYAVSNTLGPQTKMHILIMGKKGIDHKSGDGLDNRRENLRIATISQNQANYASRGGASSHRGVHWRKDRQAWIARIKVSNKWIYLGYFKDEVEAAKAYNEGALKYFGEFATLNEVE